MLYGLDRHLTDGTIMTTTTLLRTSEIFSSRLKTLLYLLGKAEEEWKSKGSDPAALLAGRIAPDMLPLPYQIVFACNQPNDLAAWLEGSQRERASPEALSLGELRAHVEAAIARQQEVVAKADDKLLDRIKHIELLQGMSVDLPGQDYVDDWLLPNFYFHIVTAYDILRHLGVTIGKADYMAHLASRVRHAA